MLVPRGFSFFALILLFSRDILDQASTFDVLIQLGRPFLHHLDLVLIPVAPHRQIRLLLQFQPILYLFALSLATCRRAALIVLAIFILNLIRPALVYRICQPARSTEHHGLVRHLWVVN